MPMTHLVPPASETLAQWIWLGPVEGDQQFLGRTTFVLRSKPRTTRVWVTGDDAFTLFINGQQVDQSQPLEMGWSRAHQTDVTSYLRVGKNTIAVRGVNKGGGGAGVLVQLEVDGISVVVSNHNWKALLSVTPPIGWTQTSFDDTSWRNATDEGVVGEGVWGQGLTNWPNMSVNAWYLTHLTMRPIAAELLSGSTGSQGLTSLLAGQKKAFLVINPTSATSDAPRQVLLDFGKELSGRLQIAGTAGAKVEVHTGESREAALHILTDPRLITIDNSGPWSLTLNGDAVQTTPYTAFRYALLTFPGNQPLTLTKADCDFKYYPVDYKGAFSCSDPLLTRIWYSGAYVAHLGMQEDIWDSPKRDRGLWIGDLHVTGETINTVFLDRFLMEKTIAGGRKAVGNVPQGSINTIPGYTAAWFGTLADFYRHDGDDTFLRSQHQNILTLLAFQQTQFDSNNLFSNPKDEWDFTDWAPGYVRGTALTRSATHLFTVKGVREAVFLLRSLGDTTNADKYAAWADMLTQAARTHLIDPKTQTYGDRIQGNAMAVYSGVATPEQQSQIYQSVLKAGTSAWTAPSAGDLAGSEVISPYYGHYVLQAYSKMGQPQAGINLIRRYWGAMLARGTTIGWEQFDPSFPQDMNVNIAKMPYLSLSHGWSTGPTSFLTECVLGVEPTEGGFKSVVVQPHLGDLRWVKGTVPTPHGNIYLRAEQNPKGLVCTLTLPRGIRALVKLPGCTVTLDKAGRYTVRSSTIGVVSP
jgi:alpha-L-rhamnosidase